MLAALESILVTTLRGADASTLFSPAVQTGRNPLNRAVFRHQQRTAGSPFALVAIEFQCRPIDDVDAFDPPDFDMRRLLLDQLARHLPVGAVQGDLDDDGTVGVFLPGGNDVAAAVQALYEVLDQICSFSLLSQRRCLVARWRTAQAVAPHDGHAPMRLNRLLRERLPSAAWSLDQVAARAAATEEARQTSQAGNTGNVTPLVRTF